MIADSTPLTDGERYFIAGMLDRLIVARESGDTARAKRLERRAHDVLDRYYRGRAISIAGEVFSVTDRTPRGRVDIRPIDALD